MSSLPSFNLLLILQLVIYSNFINPLMVLSQEELTLANTEEQLHEINSELPCLDSSSECVEQLTEAAIAGGALSAIAHSPKLKKLDERIALIDERLELMGDRKDYAESRLWTNYLPTSGVGSSVLDIINPFAWIKNLDGGGEMQRDRLAHSPSARSLRDRGSGNQSRHPGSC